VAANRPFKCANCKKAFSTAERLRKHGQKEHGQEGVDGVAEAVVLRCVLCGRTCLSRRALAIHARAKHDLSLAELERRASEGQVAADTPPAVVNRSKCRICGQAFAGAEERARHQREAHPGQHAFKCGECGRGFDTKSAFYNHRKSHVAEIFACAVCGKEFRRKEVSVDPLSLVLPSLGIRTVQ